jgi:Ser/Thr protein kinase RdoA (MazF antagonist)
MIDNTTRQAIGQWPIEVASLQLAAQRENIVYAVINSSGEKFALRRHRQGYHTLVELESELAWMAALAERGVAVPSPFTSKSGKRIETVNGHHFDVLTWMPGTPMGKAGAPLDLPDRQKTLFNLGAVLARLHEASDAWQPPPGFSRHAWNAEGLLGEQPFWGRFWENPDLSGGERELLRNARESARIKLCTIAPHLDYGLIHADPVRENVLIDVNNVQLIDFDDGGHGFRLFDLATVLLKCRSEPDLNVLSDTLQAGYHSVRKLDVTHLQFMIALRAFTYVGWIISRRDETWAPARLERFKIDALHFAEAIISSPL